MELVKLVGAVRDKEAAEKFLKERCILKEYRGEFFCRRF